MAKKTQNDASKQELREKIETDTQKFLSSGGKITVVPTGLSGVDFMKPGQKQIRLGSSKEQS